jgi:hypothetical protein
MNTKRLTTRAAMGAIAAVLAAAGFAGQVYAASANITGPSSGWTSQSGCNLASPNFFCLYFSPNHTGGVWRSGGTAVATITGTFSGGAGNGQTVRNNAASADNGTNCHVGIWVRPSYMGDSNWLIAPDKGGNLTSSNPVLRNNEASIAVDDATNCPGIGIG